MRRGDYLRLWVLRFAVFIQTSIYQLHAAARKKNTFRIVAALIRRNKASRRSLELECLRLFRLERRAALRLSIGLLESAKNVESQSCGLQTQCEARFLTLTMLGGSGKMLQAWWII